MGFSGVFELQFLDVSKAEEVSGKLIIVHASGLLLCSISHEGLVNNARECMQVGFFFVATSDLSCGLSVFGQACFRAHGQIPNQKGSPRRSCSEYNARTNTIV